MTFRKDFEVLSFLYISDLLTFNLFQRYLYCGYIDLFSNLSKKYIDVKQEEGYQKNLIDEIRNKGAPPHFHSGTIELLRYYGIKKDKERIYKISQVLLA